MSYLLKKNHLYNIIIIIILFAYNAVTNYTIDSLSTVVQGDRLRHDRITYLNN